MQLVFPHHPEWEVPLDETVLPILNQPFHYLNKGSQCYVFESLDGQHVLKLFRYDRPRSDTKVIHLFNACKAAYDLLKEETGLIFVHLNPTQMGLPTVACRDPIGRVHHFNLNEYRFAVQKKAKDFRETLESAKNHPNEMKERLDQFIDLLMQRTEKGVLNSDPSLGRNFGFLDDQGIEIDFGNYRPQFHKIDSPKEIKRYTGKLKKWLQINAPEYIQYIEEKEKALE